MRFRNRAVDEICEAIESIGGDIKDIYIRIGSRHSSNIHFHDNLFDKKIEAHSDGDVAIHSLIDALLGAIGEGDIGEHFPPTDNKWKDFDSREMLKQINHLMRKKGAKIINIDLTIICEKPRISKHKHQMEEALAQVLGIHKTRINVKATTTERMGFLGREEGIAAQAICNVAMTILEE